MGNSFDAGSTAMDVVAGYDLAGLTAVVTGGNGGLGVETARALSAAGADVTITARDLDNGAAVARNLAGGGGRVSARQLDLGDLASVRRFAADWGDRPINFLINNAGVMGGPLTRTRDGFESNVGVNHLGHFVLTTALLPALRAGAPSRLVVLTSGSHRLYPFDFDDWNFDRQQYESTTAYGRSKAANNLFAVGFHGRYAGDGITANAVMPGVIRTGLMRHMDEEAQAAMLERLAARVKTPERGAATSVWAATAPELEGRGGLYLENCAVQPQAREGEAAGVAVHSIDPVAADRLWQLSERVTAA